MLIYRHIQLQSNPIHSSFLAKKSEKENRTRSVTAVIDESGFNPLDTIGNLAHPFNAIEI